ncbi:unnamed protein product, partial [Ectocarpus sp. 12 AP-2014]
HTQPTPHFFLLFWGGLLKLQQLARHSSFQSTHTRNTINAANPSNGYAFSLFKSPAASMSPKMMTAMPSGRPQNKMAALFIMVEQMSRGNRFFQQYVRQIQLFIVTEAFRLSPPGARRRSTYHPLRQMFDNKVSRFPVSAPNAWYVYVAPMTPPKRSATKQSARVDSRRARRRQPLL